MLKQLAITTPQRAMPTPASRQASANLPAIRSTAQRPALVDRDADYDIAKLWRDRDEYDRPRSIARALTPGKRSVVERRHGELQAGLEPFTAAEQNQAVAAISRMLGGFRALRHDDEKSAVAGLDGLRHVLSPFPLWAIEAGCLAIAGGEAVIEGRRLDRRFPPNDSEVYGVVKEILRPYRAALDGAAALLEAPVERNFTGSRTADPPKPTQAEIEARIGRPLGVFARVSTSAPIPAGDGNHAARTVADIAARKARREALPSVKTDE
jgi:hypothetical protein